MPGTVRMLRLSVLLPVLSMVVFGLTTVWREARLPTAQVAVVASVALLPLVVAWLPWLEERLGLLHLPVALAVYLLCQTLLTSLLQNLGWVRFDVIQVGKMYVVEPGVLLMLPLLLIAWQYGWRGALLASAVTGTLHLAVGMGLHRLAADAVPVDAATPMLRPDLLYFLPLVVAYLGGLMRRQLVEHHRSQEELRDYAARIGLLATQQERRRLAERLQRTLGRSLAALNDQLSAIAAALQGAPEQAGQVLAGLQERLSEEVRRAQEVINDLREEPMKPGHLVEALQARTQKFTARSGVPITFSADGSPEGLTPEQELVLYHVADQTLRHAESHAQNMGPLELRLNCTEHMVALTVHSDSGCFCPSRAHGAFDLEDLEASAHLVGGHLHIEGDERRGATVAVWMPCRDAEE
ncbi:MAG: hypothetical protein RMN53_04760 [Anaerolineae bacterium]|nr:hypothetical protein [Anaerolineae bacterium]